MIHLTPFAISGLLIAIPYTILSILLLIHGKTKLARIFALDEIAVAVWGVGAFLVGISPNTEMALASWQFGYASVIFIPIFFLHSIYLFLNKKKDLILYLSYLQGFLFLYITLAGEMFSATKIMFHSIHYVQGSIYYLPSFIMWIGISFITHSKLILNYKISQPQQKKAIMILLLAVPFGFGAGTMNFLPGFGINIYPYGNFLVPIYFLVITYAILRHQLFEIDIVIKKSVAYSTLVALISILYLLTIFILERFAQGIFGYRSIIISILTAFGLGLIFVPLRHRIQRFVDRYFFKGTHEEIVQQNEQLRQEIAQSEKYKTLSTLASGVAHEVKNPLTSIKTFCEYLPQKLEDKEFLLKFSQLVGKEVDRIDHMVHELLDYGKPGPLTLKRTDMSRLITGTLELLSSKFLAQHITVTQNLSPVTPDAPTHPNSKEKSGVGTPTSAQAERRSCTLNVDPNRITQALLNLFLNAIDAMPNGGKLIVATRVKGQGSSSQSFEIVIQDTGPGIATEDLKHIFDPFFSRKDNGTGLGLAIVQGIVEQHSGKIRITSKVGVGTIVKIELPCPMLDT